ncbi:MAG: oligopeptidase B [Parasphingorhabdus sp.]|jgi:oligopeptidase B
MTTLPSAEKRPHLIKSPHGDRTDPYYWLRDDSRTDSDLLTYLEAENDYRDHLMAPVKKLRESLFDELVGRMKKDDSSVPFRDRGYYYYSRYENNKEYAIYARKKGSLEEPEHILIDQNQRAEGHEFYSSHGDEVSPNGKLLAFAEDTVGRRQYVIHFLDMDSGAYLNDVIYNCSGSMVWAADNKTLFYVDKDPITLLGKRVKKHILGTDTSQDVVVYEESDPSFYIGVADTVDHRYLIIHSSSTITDEMWYLPADKPDDSFTVFKPREDDFEYSADHIEGKWVIHTNWKQSNFRILEASDAVAGQHEQWQEILSGDNETFIDDFDIFDNYLVVTERSAGLTYLRIRDFQDGKEHYVETDESVYDIWPSINMESDTDWLRYGYTSLITPVTTYEINMRSGERRVLKHEEVLGGFDRDNYVTERTWVTARDGTLVPVSMVWQKDFKKDATAPLYQYAYGSYGYSTDPVFHRSIISLLDRGFVYAIAHVRGGQEMGRQWYENGRLLNKENTFNDFMDVTEHLIANSYCDPKKVSASGGSAGGMLMGVIANTRPDLYTVIVADVPFVDVVTTMLDESIPLTTNEFDEWGNPKEKKFYDYMLSWSPYDNVAQQNYPALLVTTGLWDSQVQYYEPAKWVAKLRDNKTDSNALIFSVDMDAGHGGASGRFRQQDETALEFAFILWQFGIN